jgi:hypothetical protein
VSSLTVMIWSSGACMRCIFYLIRSANEKHRVDLSDSMSLACKIKDGTGFS